MLLRTEDDNMIGNNFIVGKDTSWKLIENGIEPFPIQRIKWMERLFPETKLIFSEIKKTKPINNNVISEDNLTNLIYTGDIIEKIMATDKIKYVIESNVISTQAWEQMLHASTYNISFMYNWNIFKQSYRFDNDTFKMLCENTDVDNIPFDILRSNLPYPAFFIDNRFIYEKDNIKKVYRGCFVSIITDPLDRQELGLFFVEDTDESDFTYCLLPIYFENMTMAEAVLTRDKMYNVKSESLFDKELLSDIVTKAINAIIYICSSNKEIETIKVPIGNKNNSKKTKNKKNKNKKSNTMTQHLVGYRMGNTIRQTKKVYVNDNSAVKATKSTKSPHMRMAHYHHFWTGPKNKPEERKLILKFIPPLFINPKSNKDNEEFQPTLHNVK